MAPEGIEALFERTAQIYQVAYSAGAIIWLVSIVITVKDATQPAPGLYPELSLTTKISGTILTIFIGFSVWSIVLSTLLIRPISGEHIADSDDSTSYFSKFTDEFFYQHVNFGGYRYEDGKLKDLPEGNGYLSGKVTYQGEPVTGLALDIILNAQYEKKRIKTDKEGRFQIRLPEGKWFINRIDTTSWGNKPPEGDYVLVSEYEEKLYGKKFYRTQETGEKGLQVEVTSNPDIDTVNLYLRDSVKIVWPVKSEAEENVDIKKGTIVWAPYPEATKYHLKITHIKREDRGASYFPILQTVVENQTQYPLTNLKIVDSDDPNAETEYGVEIAAFKEDGTFLSESDSFTPDQSFKLKNGKQILDDSGVSILNELNISSPENTQLLFKNRKRLDAIEVLISDGKLKTASEMLEDLEGPLDAGKKQALQGYLLAKKGECEEAKRLFEQAVNEGGTTCVPASYKEDCNL